MKDYWRKGKISPRSLLSHRTTKTEVREKKSRDIACSRKVVPPKKLDPLLHRYSRDKNPARTPPDKWSDYLSNPVTRLQNAKNIRQNNLISSCGN